MIRLGMIGAGRIAGRFVWETMAAGGISIEIVCARHEDSAQRFAKEWNIPLYTDKAEELLDHVDAVYIASPHETHYGYTKYMLEHGLHVLCEKPMVLEEEQARELFELAKRKNCVLMEGIKTAYCPGFLALVELVKSGIIGQIRHVESCFTKLTPTNTRELTDRLYGGSFTELGTYSLFAVIKLLGTEYEKASFYFQKTENGLDGYAKADVYYPQTRGEARTGLLVKSEGQLVVSGTKGYILAKSPWWMTKQFEVCFEDTSKNQIYQYEYKDSGLRYEIGAFVKAIHGDVSNQVAPEESICLARLMEESIKHRWGNDTPECVIQKNTIGEIKIWAHRGMSFQYPENTLEAFGAAAELPGLTGIELDVQLTKDGQLIVIHDETVDRTTEGTGYVKDYDLKQIQMLGIRGSYKQDAKIPTLKEVLTLLEPYCKRKKLLINIELKNSKIPYEGLEGKVLAMVREYELEHFVWYSSFSPESMKLIKELEPGARTGMLAGLLEDCVSYATAYGADALHPYTGGLNIRVPEAMRSFPVRAWNMEELFFGQGGQFRETDLERFGEQGVTDVLTNVPERYLRKTYDRDRR